MLPASYQAALLRLIIAWLRSVKSRDRQKPISQKCKCLISFSSTLRVRLIKFVVYWPFWQQFPFWNPKNRINARFDRLSKQSSTFSELFVGWQLSLPKTISSGPHSRRFAIKSPTSSRQWRKTPAFTSRSCTWTERWRKTISWCNFKRIFLGFLFVSRDWQPFKITFCYQLVTHIFSVRSQTKHTTSLGCAIAAARAEGIDLIDFSPQNRSYSVKVHHDTYLPTSTDEDRKGRNKKWKMAVERSYGWATSIKSNEMTSKLKYLPHKPSSRLLCKLWDSLRQHHSSIHLLIRIKRCQC